MPEINKEVQEKLRKLALGIIEEIPPEWGFVLMTFPIGDKLGRMNYISNGKHEDVIKLLRDFVYRNKETPEEKKLGNN